MTAGIPRVTGSGTAWLANVDAGMILSIGTNVYGIVRSVTNDTKLVLAETWAGGTASGSSYTLVPGQAVANASIPPRATGNFLAVAGSGSGRLIMASGNRAYLSDRGNPFSISSTIYHELPAGVDIVGAEGVGDAVLLFTTAGVWSISNMSLDVLDDFGNIQQSVQRISGEIVLWGDPGIASWSGSVIVPAVDDVLVLAPDGSATPITGDDQNSKIRPLYRSYVASGYQPGFATVYKGHYLLTIVNGSTWVDTLVCRLDRGAVWTRLSPAMPRASRMRSSPRSGSTPAKLLAVAAQRVTDCRARSRRRQRMPKTPTRRRRTA